MKNSQNGFIQIVIIIAVIVLGGGGSIYLVKKNAIKKETKAKAEFELSKEQIKEEIKPNKPVPENKPVQVTQVATSKTPEEFYRIMRAEFDKAENFEAFYQTSLKYGTKASIELWKKQAAGIDDLPLSFKEGLVSALKSSVPSLSKIISISTLITGDRATLTVKSETNAGTVVLLRENGEWKLEKESWSLSSTN